MGSQQAECRNCGYVFSDPSTDRPCPECGSEKKHVSVAIEEMVTVDDSIRVAMENVLTGREGIVHDSEEDIPHPKVREFIENVTSRSKEPNWNDIINQDSFAKEILAECRDAKVDGLHGSYYRARVVDENASPLSTPQLLSPPEDKVSIGRYNQVGDAVLYLAQTPETAAIEVRANGQEQVYIQRFEIGAPDLSYIRLGSEMEQEFPHLHHLLLLSEYLPERAGAEEAYWPTHFLREACEQLGISAIEFPSIRADYSENPDAVNLVVYGGAVDETEQMTQGTPYIFG